MWVKHTTLHKAEGNFGHLVGVKHPSLVDQSTGKPAQLGEIWINSWEVANLYLMWGLSPQPLHHWLIIDGKLQTSLKTTSRY